MSIVGSRARTWRDMKGLGCAALVIWITACGGSSGLSMSPGTTVLAEGTGYSNASISGVYALAANGLFLASGGFLFPFDFSATLNADGNGNFTAGAITESVASTGGGSTCSGTLTGTYSVMTNGNGTAALTFTPNSSSPCTTTTTTYTIATTANGSILFAESDGNGQSSGTAQRQ